jgi:hypothetical protein
MTNFVRFMLEHALTLGFLGFLLIVTPMVGIMIIHDPD